MGVRRPPGGEFSGVPDAEGVRPEQCAASCGPRACSGRRCRRPAGCRTQATGRARRRPYSEFSAAPPERDAATGVPQSRFPVAPKRDWALLYTSVYKSHPRFLRPGLPRVDNW
ncbi:hypothetical protein SL003B_0254 [Polymorphum gilvum SL003B-26A1]|uniref:Uncharacterized protein n=1 Tax=Polymorphum gilvum (strain LMG 25793 / CGMCC 1.9160 / SL003B-26A1) TaxID=991905 RepID=F2J146_POLGS|nr:hypothetical protein SL003B_0254 [Polymorphum gilvum SL003B-26A1]